MYNVSKYTQSTLSKFDIIGSYFVNLFYNEFYSKSKVLKLNGSFINLTEAYKNILGSYLDFIKKPEFFKQIVKGIHAYCISTTKYTTMTHKECIDFMVHEFIPEKLWDSIRENQKNKLFHESIGNCISIFIENIINSRIHIIIDNHDQPENIIILQDLFLSIILLEKDKIYSKFLNPNNNNTISIDLFKEKLMVLVNEKKDLISENNNIKKKYNVIKQLNEKNTNVILELQKIHKLNIKEINTLKQENTYIKKLLAKEGKNEVKYDEIKSKKESYKKLNDGNSKKKNIINRLETLSNDSENSDDSNSDESSDSDHKSSKNIIKKNTMNLRQESIVQKKNKKEDVDDCNDDLNSLLCGNDSEENNTNNDLEFDNDIDYENDN
jgi:hypothetical protein